MTEKLLIYLILASPVFWIISITLLNRWKHFWKFFIANALILVVYLIVTINPAFIDLGHDEYGLKRFFTIVMAIFTHIMLGILFAIGYRLTKRAGKAKEL
jgi:uncharacterized RDD family membrane protein YckC